MTACAADRITQAKYRGPTMTFPVYTGAKIYNGSLVAVRSDGYAVPAADTSGFKVVGVAEQYVYNTGSSGALTVCVRTGVNKFKNSSGTPVVTATLGRLCYVADDQTVAASDSNNIVAGVVTEIDADGDIWVDVSNYTSFATVAGYVGWGSVETVTSGAIDPDKRSSRLSCTGTVAYTLANGSVEGQRKTLTCTVAASAPRGTVTPASGTVWKFNGVNDWVEYEWHTSGGWAVVDGAVGAGGGAGSEDFEVVSTATALSVLVRTSILVVDGTLAMTLPDGTYEGQRKTIMCHTGTTTPECTVTPATTSGTYAVAARHFDAAGEWCELEWHTGGWVAVGGTATAS